LVGQLGEEIVADILARQLPPGYVLEKKAPSILSQGNCDFLIRDLGGRVIVEVEVKNWAEYSVSHGTVVDQVLKRVKGNSPGKLLITSNVHLANSPQLAASGWEVAYTQKQAILGSRKGLWTTFLRWKAAITGVLCKLGLSIDSFLSTKRRKENQGVFTFVLNKEKIGLHDHAVPVVVSRVNRLRLSLVDLFLHCVPLDLFARFSGVV
jgi:Holliday junction resolvase-like predicted endonuclease